MAADISKKYIKLEQRDHVLQKPGMYLGSVESDEYEIWLLNTEGTKMEKSIVNYTAGLFKIFDEVIANASDQYLRLKEFQNDGKEVNPVKDIKVTICKETGEITVQNSGDGIDIVIHPEHKIYIPELIFGNLLTSTNYNDDKKELIGTFGIGIKICNIFSEYFEIETVDASRKLLYKQRFESNMSVVNAPVITKYTKKPYTLITFKPDYTRFNMKNLTNGMYEVLRKRVYDLCAVTDKDINIFFNDQKLEFKTFENYVNLYLGSKSDQTRVYETIDNKWEIVASYNAFGGFEQVSFVNGLLTIRGGKHVDYIVNQIVKKMTELIIKKSKKTVVKPQAIKDNMIIFIKSSIINPSFDSQSKETLTTPSSKFGSKPEVSDKFIEKLYKTGMAEKIMEICAIHEEKTLKKTDGKKRDIIRGLPKLEDANWAGTAKSAECLLLLTEGDSASSMAISGLAEIGRDKYGVFPLKGKILNVKDANVTKIADNEEISNLKKILGLETGKKYTNIDDLRYGGIMLLTDSDVDGSHIRALLMNLMNTMWPSLIKDFKFVHCMQTPIVKAKRRDEIVSFYNLTDFENWKQDNPTGWEIKYYKGLGTSTEEEAKEYFRNMNTVTYKFTEMSNEALDLAFNKKRADDRKDWLRAYDRQNILDYKEKEVSYEDFINKELIHFSNYDVDRSIPNMVDGLKISQRKIVYSCFKRNLTSKEIRVAQLAAYVSENSAYHHGEASLQGAIVGLAQDYIGSNNINLLKPNGQFGCLAPDTNVLMWDSTIKKARDVVIGDKLVGDDGTLRNVLNTTRGVDAMYEVKMFNGESYTVNKEHILTLKYADSIFDIKIDEFIKLPKCYKEDTKCVKNSSCIEWNHQDVPVDPYTYGCSLVENDEISINYIANSKETRLQLLAGIIDTHNSIKNNGELPYIDVPYIRSLKLLCNSLGFMVDKVTSRSIICVYGDGINIIPTKEKIVFGKERNKDIYTVGFSINAVGHGEFCGWSIDCNERFLLGDFTITHNSRLHGGKDAAQPRYIHTLLTDIATCIYKKQDNHILQYTEDDGFPVEPTHYVPIIPMILVNGSIGIGTGFSTTIPSYNPLDITQLLRKMLAGEHVSVDDDDLTPWYKGFTGSIKKVANKYYSVGCYSKMSATKIEVTELPIGYWTFDFKADLENAFDKIPEFKKYENKSAGNKVHFILHFANQTIVDKYMEVDNNGFTLFENTFKLVTTRGFSTTNMYAFNKNGQITLYETCFDIINEFYDVRLEFYQKRKEYILAKLEYDANFMANKIRFIKEVVTEMIHVHKMKKADLETYLDENDYMKHDETYDYIVKIPVYNLTTDKVEDLEADITKTQNEITELMARSPQEIWNTELDEFDKAYEKFIAASVTTINNKKKDKKH